MRESEKGEGFKITDKRKFTSEGESTVSAADSTAEPPASEANPTTTEVRVEEANQRQTPPPSEHFQMTFETLVLSLSSTAMVQLGVIADPLTNELSQNIPAAKQTIDILEILQQKTRGNLTDTESKLLENILYDLRMAYLEISEAIKVPR